MNVLFDLKMGFKRVLLNRITDDNNKTLISEMDENNDGNNDRKHTDFSIDKILSDDTSKILPNISVENLYRHINNEYYAYWNRRIYPPITSMHQHHHHHHQQRSAFLPTASTVTSATAHYEIMNLSLRMYDQQISLSNTVDRIRSAYAWTSPSTSTKSLESQLSLNSSSSNNNNNSSLQNNNAASNLHDNSGSIGGAHCNNKFSLYQNLKTYGINFSNLSELNAQVNLNVTPPIKSEPLTPESGSSTNLACSVCNKVFENPLILDAHERTHKSPRYKCEECGKVNN